MDDLSVKIAAVFTHNVILVELEAAAPVDSPEVGRAQLKDVQFKGLLHKHDVILRHAEAVVVAWVQCGAERHRAQLLHVTERCLPAVFTCAE